MMRWWLHPIAWWQGRKLAQELEQIEDTWRQLRRFAQRPPDPR